MGTNYYLRRRAAREVHDQYHVARVSWGWLPHFQDSTRQGWSFGTVAEPEPDPPEFHSARDIRELLESGEFDLSDEFGNLWHGADALREFDGICAWHGGDGCHGKPRRYPPLPDDEGTGPFIPVRCYQDPEGHWFDGEDFR